MRKTSKFLTTRIPQVIEAVSILKCQRQRLCKPSNVGMKPMTETGVRKSNCSAANLPTHHVEATEETALPRADRRPPLTAATTFWRWTNGKADARILLREGCICGRYVK